jgi:hemolysin III
MSTNFDLRLSPEMPHLAVVPVRDAARAPAVLALDSSEATAEVANTITHGLGFLLSLVAAVVLIGQAGHTDTWQFTACVVYVATMIAVYGASTASHAFQHPRVNHFFRMLDQGCIYLYIAGTFTPVAAMFLRDGAWWALLAAMWAIAAGGFASKMFLQHRIDCASVAIPALLGWLPLVCGPGILNRVPVAVLSWMLAGGVCYMLGTIFLINDRRHRYLHAVWHLWVIAGSACQFWAIFQYTLPAA